MDGSQAHLSLQMLTSAKINVLYCIHTFDQIKTDKNNHVSISKKTKIFGITTAKIEKQDKRRWNRTFRKVCKKLLRLEKEVSSKIQGVTSV